MILARRCSWCGALLSGDSAAPPESTTHGICPPCAAQVLATLGLKIRRDADGVAQVTKASSPGAPSHDKDPTAGTRSSPKSAPAVIESAGARTFPSPYMTRHEAAAYLRCSVSQIDRLVCAGRLKRRHVGRLVLLDRAQVEGLPK